jgi:outer membrane protein assembly factor BamB
MTVEVQTIAAILVSCLISFATAPKELPQARSFNPRPNGPGEVPGAPDEFPSLRALPVAVGSGLSDPAGRDGYWNQFRGPHANGTTTETGLPVTFGEGSPEIVWKTPVIGKAWSSPVIWDKQVWVTNSPELVDPMKEQNRLQEPLELSALCIDVDTGKIIHNLKIFDVYTAQITHPTNSLASPTPCIEAGRVYLHYGAYGTACVDTRSGKKIWERTDLPCNHFRGPGSSAVIYGDLLYLTFDGYDVQYIIALNKFTGVTVWKTDRGIDYGTTDGDAKKAYSTPLLIEAEGRKLLISPSAGATGAYDPLTGACLWTVRHGGMNAAGRPLYGNGLLYIATGDGPNPLIAVPPNGTGDITKNIAWRGLKAVPKRPSSLLIGNRLYMVNDGGVASCLDAADGTVIWSTRLPGEYWSSPLYAEGLIYCFSQQGQVPVFKAADEFELVADNKLDVGFIASPAIAGKALILRSKTHLYRIERKP